VLRYNHRFDRFGVAHVFVSLFRFFRYFGVAGCFCFGIHQSYKEITFASLARVAVINKDEAVRNLLNSKKKGENKYRNDLLTVIRECEEVCKQEVMISLQNHEDPDREDDDPDREKVQKFSEWIKVSSHHIPKFVKVITATNEVEDVMGVDTFRVRSGEQVVIVLKCNSEENFEKEKRFGGWSVSLKFAGDKGEDGSNIKASQQVAKVESVELSSLGWQNKLKVSSKGELHRCEQRLESGFKELPLTIPSCRDEVTEVLLDYPSGGGKCALAHEYIFSIFRLHLREYALNKMSLYLPPFPPLHTTMLQLLHFHFIFSYLDIQKKFRVTTRTKSEVS
jgi:hypothetical protein